MKVKIVNLSGNETPAYATANAAGMDIRSNLEVIVKPRERVLIPTGLFLEIEEGFEAQIRPRSGLAIKHGITVLNSPGTIDSDYRGEVKVIVINHGEVPFRIEAGERFCQMVFAAVAKAELEQAESISDLSVTDRGEGGFNSTGTN
jgi:dUTP pyrophosphatase